MRNPLSNRVVDIKPSGIRKFFDVVSEMEDAISLGVGEPDFDTPDNIKSAAIEAINAGRTKYTPAAGLPDPRKAIATRLKLDYELEYDFTQITVASGAKHSVFVALLALIKPGDEVILPAPS